MTIDSANTPPLGPFDRFRTEMLLSTSIEAGSEHFELLYHATLAEDYEFISRLVVGMLPTVLGRPDRFGHLGDRYGTEVGPLLGLLVGAAFPAFETYAELVEAVGKLDLAIDHAVLMSRIAQRDLSDHDRKRLDAAMDSQIKMIRSSARSIRPAFQRERDGRGTAIFLAVLGRVAAGRRLACLDDERVDAASATTLASALRRRWALDPATHIVDRVLSEHPGYQPAETLLGSVLADKGLMREAHEVALRLFGSRPNPHVAKLLMRTSKNVGDENAFSSAAAYLEDH